MVLETADGATKARYLRGVSLLAQQIDESLFCYLHNAHGDVIQRVGGDGNAAPLYEYDAFGNQKNTTETDPNPFRYCGEYLDKETGEYYLRARYYAPRVGRFTTEDSVQQLTYKLPNEQEVVDPLSLNRYTYCHNNPILFVDKSGHWVHLAVGALIGALVGGAMSAAIQYATTGSIDVSQTLIAAGAGALGGLLTAAGVGGLAAGAVVGGVEDLATQIFEDEKDLNEVNWMQVGVSTTFGAVGGVVGSKLSGIMGIPDIPIEHLDSMGAGLTKKIGNAVRYQLGQGAMKEISKAISYYYSQTATLIWKNIIRTLMIEGVRDSAIGAIIDQTELKDRAKNEILYAVYN